MKSTALFFAPLFAAALIFTISTSAFAQKVAIWKGGTPGQVTEWNCPKNWKEGQVPNEFSQVVIPDVRSSTFNNPVIASGEVEVWRILIHSGASLRIGKGARLIHECAQLNKPQRKHNRSFSLLPIFLFGLCALASSCSVEQQARAEQYRIAMAAENRTCPMNEHDVEQSNSANTNRYNRSNGYYNWHGPDFCRRCGQRIYRNR